MRDARLQYLPDETALRQQAVHPPRTFSFINESGSALVAGDVVDYDLAGSTLGLGNSILIAPAGGTGFGACVAAIADDGIGEVQTGGIQANVKVNAGVVAGDLLKVDAATDGTLETIGVGDRPIARALTAAAAGRATVAWLPQV